MYHSRGAIGLVVTSKVKQLGWLPAAQLFVCLFWRVGGSHLCYIFVDKAKILTTATATPYSVLLSSVVVCRYSCCSEE